MSQSLIVRTGVDTYVSENLPLQNFGQAVQLKLDGTSSNRKRAYIWFALPFKPGSTVISALLRLEPRTGFGSSITVTAKRITGPRTWREDLETWDRAVNGVGVAALTTTTTHQATVASGVSSPFELDLTTMLNDVAGGSTWFGVEISVTNANVHSVHSSESEVWTARPRLTIEWAQTPRPPTDLKPSGDNVVSATKPRLTWSFTDRTGTENQDAYQVQIDPTNTFGAPAHDSGVIVSPDEFYDLADTAFAALSSGDRRYWRVRGRNAAGIWSDYSDVQSFVYRPLGTVTITNPPAGAFVEENTPPLTWTFSGTQKQYEVILYRGTTNVGYGFDYGSIYGGLTYDMIWQFARRAGTDQSVTPPPGLITETDAALYMIEVRVWDQYSRQGVAGAQAYARAVRVFDFRETAGVTAPTGLVMTAPGLGGYVQGDWSRTTMPDRWSILLNGKEIAQIEGDEAFVSGTSYRYKWPKPQPSKSATYGVRAIVKTSGVLKHSNKVTAAFTYLVKGIWINQAGTEHRVRLDDVQPIEVRPSRDGAILRPVGSRRLQQIVDRRGGYEGTISGVVVGLTDKDEIERIAGNIPETRYRIHAADMAIIVEFTDISELQPLDGWIDGQPAWQVSLDFFEVAEFAFTVRGG